MERPLSLTLSLQGEGIRVADWRDVGAEGEIPPGVGMTVLEGVTVLL